MFQKSFVIFGFAVSPFAALLLSGPLFLRHATPAPGLTRPRHGTSFTAVPMSSDAAPPLLPRPSVFISYASEDRTAARTLRDVLSATGLEVWYDENELGGGDAWDQKIRRQIRDCDYFMPMISAATEARKEGYFRREWRLAAERTLDMADDVMFLLPVVIDDTSESGARVPDKFLAVQWLRLPGGQSTPALEALCRRLLAGEHSAPPRPTPPVYRPSHPSAARKAPVTPPPPPPEPPSVEESAHHAPPPMPPFPHVPDKFGHLGHGLKFLAEVLWWALTAGWMLFKRAPKWLRIVLTVWFVLLLFSRCGKDTAEIDTDKKPARERKAALITPKGEKFIRAAAEQAKADPNLTPAEAAKLGKEFVRGLAAGLGHPGAGKPLAVVPFALGLTDAAATKFADTVFTAAFGRLSVARPGDVTLAPEAPAALTDAALVAQGQKLDADFILAAQLSPDAPPALAVLLLRTENGVVAWSATFPLDDASAPAVAEKISAAVLAALPAAK